MFQPEQETLDRDALARLQLARLRATLARVRANAAWAARLGRVQSSLVFQPEQETLDREALARVQLERMRATLARARTNAAWPRGSATRDPTT